MRRLLPCFAVACVFLTGCSYVSDVGDFFTKDGDKDVLAGSTIYGRTKFTMPSMKGEAREPSWSPLID